MARPLALACSNTAETRASGRPINSAIAGAGGVLMVVGAAYCLWRFAQAPDIRGMLAWGGGAAFALFSLGLLKMWFFLEMQKNSLMREVKRLEFQVASLATLIVRPTA